MKRLGTNRLLLPLSKLYELITGFRNWLFDSRLSSSTRPDVYTISVGNLTVGGTGKTPMVEFLIKRYLRLPQSTEPDTATLSRGYGRSTTGFRIATAADTADTIGDEPRQLFLKFSPRVRVCVGERRVPAIDALLAQHPETKRILLDDAFQHRAVQPHLNLLLMDYHRPIYADYPFPAGRLREGRSGARRADAVIVTKCPTNLWATEQDRIREQLKPYIRPETPVFFAGLQYGQPLSFATRQPVLNCRNVVLVSGLANADPLDQYVRQTFQVLHHHRFADHYAYTRADIVILMANLPAHTFLLTTEKDWVKLDALLSPEERAVWPLAYLPVSMAFLPGYDLAFTQLMDGSDLKNR